MSSEMIYTTLTCPVMVHTTLTRSFFRLDMPLHAFRTFVTNNIMTVLYRKGEHWNLHDDPSVRRCRAADLFCKYSRVSQLQSPHMVISKVVHIDFPTMKFDKLSIFLSLLDCHACDKLHVVGGYQSRNLQLIFFYTCEELCSNFLWYNPAIHQL